MVAMALGPTATPSINEKNAHETAAYSKDNDVFLEISKPVIFRRSLPEERQKGNIQTMNQTQKMKKLLQQIQVVRAPKHRLATFGVSRIEYKLVTDVSGMGDRCRLRSGVVTAEKPSLITPQTLQDRFSGFGDDSKELSDLMTKQYGLAFMGLEYQFRNEPISTRVELSAPDAFMSHLVSDFDRATANFNSTLIRGGDKFWELSVMKFIVEETLASFSSNVQELKERGFLDGENRQEARQRREIEHLFAVAKKDRGAISALGKKLKDYGLFDEYQDAFFRLVG
jgi:hypothetical protein